MRVIHAPFIRVVVFFFCVKSFLPFSVFFCASSRISVIWVFQLGQSRNVVATVAELIVDVLFCSVINWYYKINYGRPEVAENVAIAATS